MDAPCGHSVASMEHHLNGFLISKSFRVAQKKLWLAWLWEFGRSAEAAMAGVVRLLESKSGVVRNCGCEQQVRAGDAGGCLLQPRMNLLRRIAEVAMPRPPKLVDVLEHLQKTRP